MYERVSLYNTWDGTISLANVIFYLKDTTDTWFEIHNMELTSWDYCESILKDLLAKPIGHQLLAKTLLRPV